MIDFDATLVQSGERLDDLEYKGMHIISHKNRYCFTSDSVMLANMVGTCSHDTVIDLCTGGGIIALLIAGKTNAKRIIGVELQTDMADMARRSVQLNDMSNKVEIIQGDVANITEVLGHGMADIVVCNPPYYKTCDGASRLNECMAIARHEIKLSLEQMIKTASELTRFGGYFYMIHKAERLAEVIMLLVQYNLAPKQLYNITTKSTQIVDTFIVVCKKGGKSGTKVYAIPHD